MYVKDPNGKYKLVDKETQTRTSGDPPLSLEELDDRLRKVEALLFQGRE
jgi:hypothetical protein